MAVKTVARWQVCGKDRVEEMLTLMSQNEILPITGEFAIEIIKEKTEDDLVEVEQAEHLWPTRDYYLYITDHPGSNLSTQIEHDHNQIFKVTTLRHGDASLAAFFTEVLIFRFD